MAKKESAEKAVRDIRRKTRRRFSAEEKIRIVIEGLRGAPARRRRASRRVVDGFATFVTITKDGARLVKVDSSDLGVCGFEPGLLAETGAECDRQAKFFKVHVASLSDFALFRLDPVVPALRGWSIGAASVLHMGAGLLSQIHLKIRRRPE